MVHSYEKKLNSLYVIYTPNCGCKIKVDFLLDRYPMSKKIMAKCYECKKACLYEISDPIEFYHKLTKTKFSLKDLKEAIVTEDCYQRPFIEAYQREIK